MSMGFAGGAAGSGWNIPANGFGAMWPKAPELGGKELTGGGPP